MRTIAIIKWGTLALGVVLAVPAFAQEVWQTYPMTASTPAFGPGPVTPATRPVYNVAPRPLYNVAPRPVYNAVPWRLYNVAPQAAAPLCEVWQTYPMTASTPANGHYVESCQ